MFPSAVCAVPVGCCQLRFISAFFIIPWDLGIKAPTGHQSHYIKAISARMQPS